jgi:Transglutaminase-like superfamily
MRYLLLFAFALFWAGQSALAQGFAAIDSHARSIPVNPRLSIAQHTALLIKPCKTEIDRARCIFTWICHHIAYDVDSYTDASMTKKEMNALQDPARVLRRRKAVCMGYAQLYQVMCQQAGLSCILVEGDAKDPIEGKIDNNSGHAWNLVKADGRWGLVDATWGAGNVNSSNVFERDFSPEYYLMPPSDFVQLHYPGDPLFQLLARPVRWKEFRQPLDSNLALNARRSRLSPDAGFEHLADTLNAWLALDTMTQRLRAAKRALQINPGSAYGRLLNVEYYMHFVQQEAKAYSAEVDLFNAGKVNSNKAWADIQYARFDRMDAGLQRCLEELRQPVDEDYNLYQLKYYAEQVPRLQKSYRLRRRELEEALK